MFAPPQRLYKVTKSWKDSLRKLQTQGFVSPGELFSSIDQISMVCFNLFFPRSQKKIFFLHLATFQKLFLFFKTTVLQPCFRGLS